MKILLVGPFPSPIHGMSLANSYLYELAKNDDLDIIRHDTVFSRELKSKNKQGKFNFKFFVFSLMNIISIFNKIISNNVDLLYITPGQSVLGFLRYLPVILLAKIFNINVTQHIHGSKLVDNISASRFPLYNLSRLNIYLSDSFIVLSETIFYQFKKIIPEYKMNICPNGVEWQEKKCHVRYDRLNVLFLSNLMKDKGILDLFNTIEYYDCTHIDFNFAGAIEPELQHICDVFFKKNKINCSYHGVVSGEIKKQLFESADVFILPSYDEGVPLSILEAYSFSCAVITTSVGGIPDIFSENENGLFVDKNDANSIYIALNQICNKLKFYQESNYKLFLQKYTLDDFYQGVKKVLYKVS